MVSWRGFLAGCKSRSSGPRVSHTSRAFCYFHVVSDCLVTGRLPFPFMVPRRAAITGVVGAPVEVVQMSQPTQAAVDAVHQQLCDQMVATFDAHKKSFGWKHCHLELL